MALLEVDVLGKEVDRNWVWSLVAACWFVSTGVNLVLLEVDVLSKVETGTGGYWSMLV